MQVSKEWLSEFIDLSDITDEQIVHELTMSGLEVEEVEITKPKFSNIRVAKILEIDNHPNADKLHLVKVDIDEAKILLDLNAFTFVDDTKFVSTTIGQAMHFALRNNTLPKSYIENEYITPLGKLEDFLLTSST